MSCSELSYIWVVPQRLVGGVQSALNSCYAPILDIYHSFPWRKPWHNDVTLPNQETNVNIGRRKSVIGTYCQEITENRLAESEITYCVVLRFFQDLDKKIKKKLNGPSGRHVGISEVQIQDVMVRRIWKKGIFNVAIFLAYLSLSQGQLIERVFRC